MADKLDVPEPEFPRKTLKFRTKRPVSRVPQRYARQARHGVQQIRDSFLCGESPEISFFPPSWDGRRH
jgi:hypothetical protein